MPISTAGRLSKQQGFTLIELVLVVVLLGLFAGLGLPLLSSVDFDRLDATGRRLAGTVKYFYNEAILTGYEHQLTLDLDQNRISVARLEANGELQAAGGPAKSFPLREGITIESVDQPQRGERRSGQVTCIIYPGGWLDETVIHLRDEDMRRLTLRLAPLTGLTDVYQGYRDFR